MHLVKYLNSWSTGVCSASLISFLEYILLIQAHTWTASYKNIQLNSLVVALPILQKMEVGLRSWSSLFWRCEHCSCHRIKVLNGIRLISDIVLLSWQDGYRAVRFNPYLWPSGQKVLLLIWSKDSSTDFQEEAKMRKKEWNFCIFCTSCAMKWWPRIVYSCS